MYEFAKIKTFFDDSMLKQYIIYDSYVENDSVFMFKYKLITSRMFIAKLRAKSVTFRKE